MTNTAISDFNAVITVNGVIGTVTIEERFLQRFGVQRARPQYQIVLAHGQYVNRLCSYTNKAFAMKDAAAEAAKFLAASYPAPKPVEAPVVHVPFEGNIFDFLDFPEVEA